MAGAEVVFFRGGFVPLEEARVSVRVKGLNYGLGCFEGIRAYWNAAREQLYLFRAPEHYERLHRSLRILDMPAPMGVAEMVETTRELLRRNAMRQDTYIRPLAFSGSEHLSPMIVPEDMEFAIYVLPLADYLDTSKGVKAVVSSWVRVSDNMIPAAAKPTAAYLNSALARLEARKAGADEGIFLTKEGYVSEGSAEHLFLVRDGVLITPANEDDNLEGITRDTLLRLAREDLGLQVQQRHVRRTELYVADEAFFCGTGAQVTPVVEIDGRPVGDGRIGPLTRRLQSLYWRVVHGEVEKYAAWCTPVYPS